jgi:hypothetical protein
MEGDANGGKGMGFSMHHLTKPPRQEMSGAMVAKTTASNFQPQNSWQRSVGNRVQLKRQKVVDTTGQQRITLWYAGAQKLLITSLNVARAG